MSSAFLGYDDHDEDDETETDGSSSGYCDYEG